MSEAVEYNPFLRWSSAEECYDGLARDGIDLVVKGDDRHIWCSPRRKLTEHEKTTILEEVDAFGPGLIAIITARDALPPAPVVEPTPTPPAPTYNCILIDVPYDEDWQEDLKGVVPWTHLQWLPKPEKVWVVWEPYCDRASDLTERYFPDEAAYGDAIETASRPPKRRATPPVPSEFNVTTLPAPIPSEVRAEVWEKTNGLCWYCGTRLVPHRTFHVDHVHPRSDGGTDDLANLVPACATCNADKGSQLIETFRLKRGGGLFWFEIVKSGGGA